jgi:hypothetical protein
MGTRDRHPKTVRFASYLAAYKPLRNIPNVRAFARQVKALRGFFGEQKAVGPDLSTDTALMIAAGKCFSAVVYGQLVAENCVAGGVDPGMVSAVFHALIEDLNTETIRLATRFAAGSPHRRALQQVVRIPRTTTADFESVFRFFEPRFAASSAGPAAQVAHHPAWKHTSAPENPVQVTEADGLR